MKKTFNELDQWLAQNWTAARELEDSIIAVRAKYKTVFERVIEVVHKAMPELDNCWPHLSDYGGCAAFARGEWPSKWDTWPPGLWIEDISLDNLMSNEGDTPSASIWLAVPKGTRFDLEEARTKIQKAAGKLLKGEKLKCFFKDKEDPKTCFWYDFPESRQALAKMLLDNESEKFIECIESHVMILARFIPVLDDILLKKKR